MIFSFTHTQNLYQIWRFSLWLLRVLKWAGISSLTSIAKFSLNSEGRTRSHSPQWWEMHRQVMRREITENSLARAPPDCCQCPLHVSPLLKHMDHICVPSCQEHCTWHLMCLPQIPSACRASCFQFGNTSHPEKSSSPACCDGIEQVNPFERVLGQLPSLPVGTPSKLDSSSSDSDCSLSYFE